MSGRVTIRWCALTGLHPLDAFEVARRATGSKFVLLRGQILDLIQNVSDPAQLPSQYRIRLEEAFPENLPTKRAPLIINGALMSRSRSSNLRYTFSVTPLRFDVSRGDKDLMPTQASHLVMAWLTGRRFAMPSRSDDRLLERTIALFIRGGLSQKEIVTVSVLGSATVQEAWQSVLRQGQQFALSGKHFVANSHEAVLAEAYMVASA